MEAPFAGRPEWAAGPLNAFMHDIFPTHRTKRGVLDIHRLKVPLGVTHETVYRWLRTSRLKPEYAKSICALAGSPENVAALTAAGREAPEIKDFHQFVFA